MLSVRPEAWAQLRSLKVAARCAPEWRNPMADREDIIDLLTRYATGIDRQDWPLFRSVFTADCVLDYGQIGSWHGVDGVTDYMIQVHVPFEHTLHRLSN